MNVTAGRIERSSLGMATIARATGTSFPAEENREMESDASATLALPKPGGAPVRHR
jgi:hypothetical protein